MSAKNEKARREAEALKAKQAAESAEVENQNNEAETSDKTVFVNGNDPQFDNLDWLKETSPAPFHVQANVSSKYDVKREPEILLGLEKISEIMPDQLPVELIMLAKWWEVKPARAAIKKLIDAKADAEGYDKVTYMQDILRKKVDELNAIKGCIDRLSYTITYFKPRKDFVSKVPMKQIRALDGEIYKVPVNTLEQIKQQFAGDREAISKAIIEVGEKVGNEVEEL